MKFRDFVDEKIVIRKKKHVAKPKSKKEILEDLGIDKNGNEIKDTTQYYFGYGLSKIQLKRFFDYFRSWLIRYDIQFKSINPNLMLYCISNVNKNKFISIINDVNKPRIYPLGTIEFDKGLYVNYVMDKTFSNELDFIFNSNNIDIIGKVCYVKILEFDDLSQKMMDDISYSMPKIPYLVLGNPVLIRS